MSVKAKFKVTEIRKREHWVKGQETIGVTLFPVTGDSVENKAFYAATPSGNIVLDTINQEAGNQFELGKEYYITFEKAENE